MDNAATLVESSPGKAAEAASALAEPTPSTSAASHHAGRSLSSSLTGSTPSTSAASHHMDRCLSVHSWQGQMAIELFPNKQQVIKGCLSHEIGKLDQMLLKAVLRHAMLQEEIIKLIHLYCILYFRFSDPEVFKRDLDEFYSYTMLSEERLYDFCKGSYLKMVARDGFWKLLEDQKKLYQDFCSQEDTQACDAEKVKISFNFALREALKLCCERKFPFLFHLLVDVAKINVNGLIDSMCHTKALHHAAISGNLSAISYLLCKGAELNVEDRYQCTPLHYAKMFGHKMTAEYLISQDDSCSVTKSKCANGYTAVDYSEALSIYMKTRGVEHDSFAYAHNDAYLLTQYHLQKLESHWMNNGIAKSVNEINVDMSHGEDADVQKAVVNTMKTLLSKVALENPIFEGELKQLGSSADGVRLFCPDEFDFNLIFSSKMCGYSEGGLRVEIKEYDKQTAANKGHNCYVSVTTREDSDSPCQEDLIRWADGSELLPELFRLVKLHLKDSCIEDSRLCIVPPGVRHKMVGIGVTFRWSGQKHPLLLIDVDLVPVVRAPWPKNLHRPPLLTDDVQSIYASTSLTNEWRLSSGILENDIMLNLTKVQKDVFLACKRLVSTLKIDGWVPTQIKQQYRYFDNQLFRLPILNGFILKNCFFQEMEEKREKDHWHEDKMLERIDSIFQKMCNQDDDGSGYYVPTQVYAYFGGAKMIIEDGVKVVTGATDKSYVGYGAPEILEVVYSLKGNQNQTSQN